MPSPLIDPVALHELRTSADGTGVAVLDVRWALGRTDGPDEHRRERIPGSVFVDLDRELAAPPATAQEGRHPLPTIDDLQAAARRWGVRSGGTVVVADDASGTSAARAWWLLRHAGVTDVLVLDGGLAAWRAAGLPTESGEPTASSPGDVDLAYGSMVTIDLDGAAAFPGRGTLLDARAAARFRGETEPIDPVAGHIPGARNAPTTDYLDPDGRMLPADALRERFVALGVDPDAPVAAYCGSGVTAAHTVLALELAGIRAALFPGSWSEWSNHPDRPVATGA